MKPNVETVIKMWDTQVGQKRTVKRFRGGGGGGPREVSAGRSYRDQEGLCSRITGKEKAKAEVIFM